MSFRADDQRRYGHVPPVQYPTRDHGFPARRPSFNSGDDSMGFPSPSQSVLAQAHSVNAQGFQANQSGSDELFLGSPTADGLDYRGAGAPYPTMDTVANYHHHQQIQYPAEPSPSPTPPASYNQQPFPRSSSTSLPYHPHPSRAPSSMSRYSVSAGSPTPLATTTPLAYNPAAYASTMSPQRQSAYGYGSYANSHVSPAYLPPQSPTFSPPASSHHHPQFQQQPLPSQPMYDHNGTLVHQQQQNSPGYGGHVDPAAPMYDSAYAHSQTIAAAAAAAATTTTPYAVAAPYGSQTNGASPNHSHYSNSASPQPPYPLTSQIPVGPVYDSNSSSYMNRLSRSGSQSSTASSTGILPPAGLQRHPTNAPLPNRPMDDVPEETAWEGVNGDGGRMGYDLLDREHQTQEDIMHDIEAELSAPASRRPLPVNGRYSEDDELGSLGSLHRYNSDATTVVSRNPSSATSGTHVSRNHNHIPPLPGYDEDDDPEGSAGVLAMQQAEMDDRRFSGSTFGQETPASARPPPPVPPKDLEYNSSNDDFEALPAMDLGLMSGGYAGNLAYGDESLSPNHTGESHQGGGALVPAGYDYRGLATDDGHGLLSDDQEEHHHHHHHHTGAGGPQHDEEDDEPVAARAGRGGGSESPFKQGYEELFYHPGLSNRPLPAVPPIPGNINPLPILQIPPTPQTTHWQLLQQQQQQIGRDGRLAYAPDTIYSPSSAQHVERSISLTSHTNTPQVQAPARSRTDAAEERKRHAARVADQDAQFEAYDSAAADFGMIALPTGRKRKFQPSKFTQMDIERCEEPWALSGLAAWMRDMTEGEYYLKTKDLEEGYIKLFTSKVPTMHVADAETLSASVVALMLDAGILVPEEEWIKFGSGTLTGVLWQLTGHGCYAPKLHDDITEPPPPAGRCYSYHCGRTLKKARLDHLSFEVPKQEDWATFYNVTKEMLEGRPKAEVERQNNLHEIVTGEERYINELEVVRVLYRDQLRSMQPPIIAPNKLDKFISAVFGKVDAVQAVNKDHLLAQLKYRQQEQGPWVVGFTDLLREWIRKARTPYLEFAAAYPYAVYLIRKEADRNLLFSRFLDDVRGHRLSMRLDWTNFIKAPITRLQRYSFLLDAMKKNSPPDSEETANLEITIKEIKAVTLEADAKVDEKTREVQMMELNSMLVLRPGFHPSLHLDHLGRELILQGDLTRVGSKGVRWVESHVLLFDHYLILAKVVGSKDGRGEKKYDVSKEPIPMRLLFLESCNDDPIPKQKSITAPLSRTSVTATSDTKLNKITSNGSDRPAMEHTATNSSMTSVTRLTPAPAEEGKILYPFRVKHLGHEVYTLYASSPQSRNEWCTAITNAKERHAAALWAQRAEPFRIRVIADSSFAYDSMTPVTRSAVSPIKGTPLDRAIREIEVAYRGGVRPAPVCRATVNCATSFTAYGKPIIAIGTDYGVFISSASDPRGWMRTVQSLKVTQMAVLEEFSVCLVISDRCLVSYPLDVVAPVSNYPVPGNDTARRTPTRLAKDVTYFATARMKDRMLVFFKRKEGLHNTFKVLEPVFQKTTEKKSRLFGRKSGGGAGVTEIFRDFDEFYLPTECYSLNIFQTYIAVSTAKGFEMLTLDKKQPMSIPDVKDAAIASVASRIRDLRPLGMFRLNDQEYILAYEECAVYVDRHGDVSRTLIMEFSGKQRKARGATMHHPYLILFNDDYVEVRNAENGRLKQIIAGKDVRVLDYGDKGPTGPGGSHQLSPHGAPPNPSLGTVKISMAHPENPGMQVVLELVLNEGHAVDGT